MARFIQAAIEALTSFSALQRAEIAEITACCTAASAIWSFSALQRAEIAEIRNRAGGARLERSVSVLFNEPKLLKWDLFLVVTLLCSSFSALQRAEIAEIGLTTLRRCKRVSVSVLFNEPKLLKCTVSLGV